MLLRQLVRTRPKLLLLIAPAGYGKSFTARAYVGSMRLPNAVFDFRNVTDAEEFLRRLNATWSSDGGPRMLVLENVHALDRIPGARELLARLLDERSEHLSLAVCSRGPLNLRTGGFALPHETRIVRAHDLRFSPAAIADQLSDAKPSRAQVDRLFGLTCGWPIAVLAARRRALESTIDIAIADIDTLRDIALDDYILDEVIGAVSAAARTVLLLASKAPLTAQDIEVLLASERAPVLEELGNDESLLHHRPNGTLVAHPLVSRCIARHYSPGANAAASALGRSYERARLPLRAARWFVRAEDTAAANASYSSQTYAQMALVSGDESAAAAQIDPAILVDNLALFNVAAIEQLYVPDLDRWFAGAEEALHRAGPETPANVRDTAIHTLATRYAYFGRFHDGHALLASQAPHFGTAPGSGVTLLLADAFLLAAADRFIDLGTLRRDLGPILLDPYGRAGFATVASQVYMLAGDWPAERSEFEIVIAILGRSQQTSFLCESLMCAIFAAWLNGDDAAVRTWSSHLERLESASCDCGRSVFLHCLRGESAAVTEGNETPQIRWRAYLIAAAAERDAGTALRLARRALAEAERTARPMFRILCHVALALLQAPRANEHVRNAIEAASGITSPALRLALEAISERAADAGMLESFRSRFVRRRSGEGLLHLRALSGTVEWNGAPVALEARPRQLLFAIALAAAPLTSTELAERLWPDREPESMLNALRVHVSAVRKALGKSVLSYDVGAYRIVEPLHFDLDTAEALVQRSGRHIPVSTGDRAALRAIVESVDGHPRAWLDLEWFAAVEQRITELSRATMTALAEDALHRRDIDDALRWAHRIVAFDPCNEQARSVAIRAYTGDGREGDAVREHREYRVAMRRELGVELPGDNETNALTDLIRSSQRALN